MSDTAEKIVNDVEEKNKSSNGTKKNSTKTASKSKTTTAAKTTTAKTKKVETDSKEKAKTGTKKTTQTKKANSKAKPTESEEKIIQLEATKEKTESKKATTGKTTSSNKTTKKKTTNSKKIQPEEKKVEKNDKVKIINENMAKAVETDEKEKVVNTEENTKNIIVDEVEEEKKVENDESKYDTISLKEIREALENKVDSDQKKSVIKEVLINIGIALCMILYLILIMVGSKNIAPETLYKDIKVMTLFILLIGIVALEISYKKDNLKIAMRGIEILVFGATNVCLIYIAKLYFNSIVKFLGYIGLAVVCYYVVKSIVLSINSIRKYKQENNDIKDIVQKKKNEEN